MKKTPKGQQGCCIYTYRQIIFFFGCWFQVRRKIMENGDEEEVYQTELVQMFSEEDEVYINQYMYDPKMLKKLSLAFTLQFLIII